MIFATAIASTLAFFVAPGDATEAEEGAQSFRNSCAHHIRYVTDCGDASSTNLGDCIDCLVSAVSDAEPFDPDAEICRGDPDWEAKKDSICGSMAKCEENRCGDLECLEDLSGLAFCLSQSYKRACAFCPDLFDECARQRLAFSSCGGGHCCQKCVENVFDAVEYKDSMSCKQRKLYVCANANSCEPMCGSCYRDMIAYRDCKDHDSSTNYHRECPDIKCDKVDFAEPEVAVNASINYNSPEEERFCKSSAPLESHMEVGA
ncbi:hypothetical protein ACHAWF_002808 [Thalassiosira exigua]